ncbi:PepSY domain-containing protein, partial [Pseudomonas sp. SIMBA_068]
LDPLLYRDLMVVEAGHHRQPADTLLAEVHKAYPQGHVGQYLPPLDAERSAQFVVHDGGRELNVFVDPYSGKLLGEQDGK